MSETGERPIKRHAVAATLGESPVWCAASRRLWFVDIRGPALYRLDPSTGAMERFAFRDLLGMVVLARNGVLVGHRRSVVHFDSDTGASRTIAELPAPHPAVRINEAKVGPDGSLWCGTMRDGGGGTEGTLVRVFADGTVRTLLTGVGIPNGLAFSPDGAFVYFTDTRHGAILRGDARAEDPGFALFAPLEVAPGRPDGATVDADGYLWVARYGAGALARLDPAGRLDHLLALPASQPTSCAFGGDDLKTLFVTTARQRMSAEALAGEPAAGDTLAIGLPTGGIAERPFGA